MEIIVYNKMEYYKDICIESAVADIEIFLILEEK